jgi:hypothetical protein
MIKIGRRGSQNGTLIVTGTQGHVAYPELADNPVRGLVTLIAAINAEPLDSGTAHFGPSNLEFTSIDIGNKTVNLIPAEARARFNIRFNETRTREELRAEVERRAAKAAGNAIRWSIDWEPSNADVFITMPGPFVEMISKAVTEVTGIVPRLSTTGGTSDARFIKDYCPVIEFGLLSQQMHKVDEHVATADLVALTAIYRHILQRIFRRMIPKSGNRFSDKIMLQNQFSLIPVLRARSSHFAMSALTKAVNASGAFGAGSAPCSARRCFASASRAHDRRRRSLSPPHHAVFLPARTTRTSRATDSPAGRSRRWSENRETAPSAQLPSCRSRATCRPRCAASPPMQERTSGRCARRADR